MIMTELQKTESRQALYRLCAEIGSAYKLAKIIHVNSTAVYEWLDGKKEIPILRAFDIDLYTHGRYSAGALRPDLHAKYNIDIIFKSPKKRR